MASKKKPNLGDKPIWADKPTQIQEETKGGQLSEAEKLANKQISQEQVTLNTPSAGSKDFALWETDTG